MVTGQSASNQLYKGMGNTRARHEPGALNNDATLTPHEEAHWMAGAMSLDAFPVCA